MQHKTDDLYQSIPRTIEIAFLPSNDINKAKDDTSASTSISSERDDVKESFFPGIFLSTTPARFVRPV